MKVTAIFPLNLSMFTALYTFYKKAQRLKNILETIHRYF